MSEKTHNNSNGQKLSGSLSAKLSLADSFAGKATQHYNEHFSNFSVAFLGFACQCLLWVLSALVEGLYCILFIYSSKPPRPHRPSLKCLLNNVKL